MKRLSFLLAAAALLVAIAGCQKEPVGNEKGEMTKAYIEFSLNFADDGTTKADYQPDTDPNTDGTQTPGTAVGVDDEHKVTKAVFYFFKKAESENAANTFARSIVVNESNITSGVSDENHVKKTTVPTELETGTYIVYATINTDFTSQLSENSTDATFCDIATTFTPAATIPADGLPMSSRDNEGNLSCEVTLSSANTFEHPATVSLYMERLIAKISMKNTAASYTIKDVASVALTDYKVVNLTTNTYLFRHVASFGTDMAVSDKSYGSIAYTEGTTAIQVMDPQTSIKVEYTETMPTGVTFTNLVSGDDAYTTMPTGNGMNTIMYCNENVMTTANQLNTYATAIAFKASITPVEKNYYVTKNGQVEAGQYESGDLWYFDGKFYDALATLSKDNDFTLTDTNYGDFGVKHFEGGVCYYTYYIKHYDNFKPLELGFMEYAIVRNNDYQVTVTNITDLGEDTPGADPDPVEMEESYFQATLLVRPWVVRAQEAVLG